MDLNRYRECMTGEILMGPNSARILQELLTREPLGLGSGDMVLDLVRDWFMYEDVLLCDWE